MVFLFNAILDDVGLILFAASPFPVLPFEGGGFGWGEPGFKKIIFRNYHLEPYIQHPALL
jgi:hypothetical protein